MGTSQLVGAKIHRREDPRLVTGHGRYTDDLNRTGLTHLAVVRSPHSHAKIRSIDLGAAKKAPGVLGVFTAQDFNGIIAGPATFAVAPVFAPEKKTNPPRYPIAKEEVCYQGEPVAVVVAEPRYQAADAAQLIDVEYEPLPAVMSIDQGLKGDVLVHTDQPDNIAWDATYVPWEATEALFKEADVVVKERILQQRLSPNAMEARVVMAEYDPYDKRVTVWLSTQNPHWIRLFVAGALGMGEHAVRVVSHDVGGGFGSKISPYPEDFLVPAVSKLIERPVKWNGTRTEAGQNAYAGRAQHFDVEVAAKKDGTLLAMRCTQYLDTGAYIGLFGAFQTCACLLCGGAYKWKAISSRSIAVLTNRTITDPYRGAGRPEATHVAETMMDILAAELKMDPAELRRKNFPDKSESPFTQTFGLVMDSGDYHGTLDKAMKLFGYDDMRKQQAAARKQGKLVGIGLSTWIEICGLGPGAATGPATGGVVLSESAQVKVHPAGGVSIYVGTHNHGQGNDTTHAQIAADALGVPMESIDIRHGDTNEGPGFGYGTYGSRSLAVGGVAISRACGKVVDKAKKVAAHILEAAGEDIVFDHRKFQVNELDRRTTPSPTTELGVRGIGEPATIAAPGAIMNAIPDALSPLGVKHVDMPATPDRLWKLIQEARK